MTSATAQATRRPDSSAARAASGSAVRSTAAIAAPSPARAWARCRPRPLPAPVTRATRLTKEFIGSTRPAGWRGSCPSGFPRRTGAWGVDDSNTQRCGDEPHHGRNELFANADPRHLHRLLRGRSAALCGEPRRGREPHRANGRGRVGTPRRSHFAPGPCGPS